MAKICQHGRQYTICGDCWNNRCDKCHTTLDGQDVCLVHGKRTQPSPPLASTGASPYGDPVTAKLVRLSLCPCGYPLLREDIALGAEYEVYPDTANPEEPFTLICGGCNKRRFLYGRVLCSSLKNPAADPSFLPTELFDLFEEWPDTVEEKKCDEDS